LRDLHGRIDGIEDYIKILAATTASAQGKGEDEFIEEIQTKKPDLIKQFESIRQNRETKAKADEAQRELQAKVASYQKQTEDLGLTEADETYWEIRGAVEDGNYKLAELKLKKAAEQKPKPEGAKQSEEEIFAKRLAEEKRKWMEGQGLLTTETGTPSPGAGKVDLSTVASMSQEEYTRNRAAILKAMGLEGAI